MGFNLSAWALRNRQIVLFLMLLLAIVGGISYTKLGQSEDPPFTFKAMVIRTLWPGASAEEVSRQVTERIEKKLMETGEYERIVSFSRPGESQVTFMARDSMHSDEVPALWYQVRKKISDIRQTLPPDIQGPFFNDEFGTTFGNIYSLSGEGFDYALLKDYAERIQIQLQRVKDVGKVELLGLQDEKIWVELSNLKLATLGLPLAAVQKALEEQNAVSTAGFFETPTDRVQLRVSGNFKTVEEIERFPIRVGERTLRISDVADVRRGFTDPPAPRMRFMGNDAIGLAVAMKDGGDILVLGKALEAEFERVKRHLPAGMVLSKVSDQPAAVKTSVGEFVQVLGSLGFLPEAGTGLENTNGASGNPMEIPHDFIEIGGQHGPEASLVIQPEDLLRQGVIPGNGHPFQHGPGNDRGGGYPGESFSLQPAFHLLFRIHGQGLVTDSQKCFQMKPVVLNPFSLQFFESLIPFFPGFEGPVQFFFRIVQLRQPLLLGNSKFFIHLLFLSSSSRLSPQLMKIPCHWVFPS